MAERLLEEIRRRDQIDLSNSEDPVSVYIFGLAESIKKLQAPLSWGMSHNRRRSIHGMAVARDQRQHQLRETRAALDIIKKREFDEIKFYKNEKGKVVGYTIKP